VFNITRYPGKKTRCTIVPEAGWTPGLVWSGAKIVVPAGIQSPDSHDITLDNCLHDPKDTFYLLHCEYSCHGLLDCGSLLRSHAFFLSTVLSDCYNLSTVQFIPSEMVSVSLGQIQSRSKLPELIRATSFSFFNLQSKMWKQM
jgi:hypothetical protein